MIDSLVGQLTHCPFPDVADALRREVGAITRAWVAAVRRSIPGMRNLTFEELEDSTPTILRAIADALASDDPASILGLVDCAPAQGLSRLALNFDVVEVMQEDRLLRAVTVRGLESGLGRRLDPAQAAALHAALDLMLQRSVIALVDEQKARLRAAAETELKFLSFLSHDLSNNLGGVRMWLEVLGRELAAAGAFADAEESLAGARRSIDTTVGGMRRMLDHERLRKSGKAPTLAPVDLAALASKVAKPFAAEADRKGIRLDVAVSEGTVIHSDGELLALVLQNLIGNAVKYSTGGTVHIDCAHCGGAGGDGNGTAAVRPTVWVSDEGPGIAGEQLTHIFAAFRRGDVHGQSGVGLGLAIASQAASLLGADLTVESQVGLGSTFRLTLPAADVPTADVPAGLAGGKVI